MNEYAGPSEKFAAGRSNYKETNMPLPDVASALKSFQEALIRNTLQVRRGELDREMLVHMDRPDGETRLSYARMDGRTVVALVQFIPCDPVEGEPCFSVGWAVEETRRGQGKAREVVLAALREMRNGFTRAGMNAFWVEAIVGEDNIASQKLAERVISPPVKTGTDSYSGDPIVQYLRRIEAQSEL
ncbi:GNAT family N-acetyltransferase [Variovorax atrisoli]|uniref:GNAT family N-acetyltransferase n=1 Tax=Variovorax atrisoli TaxID=3394203 RepID=UPI003395FC35